MPVFDFETKTLTRARLDKDTFHPDMGVLVRRNFTESAFVNGTQNIDVMGAAIWHYYNTLKFTVEKAVTRTFNDDYTYMVLGKTDGTHVGAHTTLNVAAKNSTFISPLTDNHSAPRTVNEPTVKLDNAASKVVIGVSQTTVYGSVGTVAGDLTQVAGKQTQLAGINMQLTGLNFPINGAQVALNIFNLAQDILMVQTQPVKVFCKLAAGANAEVGTNPGSLTR